MSAKAGAVADEQPKVSYASLVVPFFDRFRGQRPFVWIALAVGIALFALYPFSVTVLIRSGGVETSLGWTVRRDGEGGLRVTAVDTNGPANGALSIGDRLVSMNGVPPLARGLGWTLFMDLRPGDRYRVRIERGPETVERELTVASRSNLQDVWLIQVPLLVISSCFFATGLGVALLSAKARVARLYATTAMLVAALLIPGGVFLGDLLHGRDRAVLLTVASFIPFVYPVIYQFFAEFPPGVPRHWFWHRVTFILYAWAAAFFPVNVQLNVAASHGSHTAVDFIQSHPTLFAINDVAATLYQPTAVIAIVGVIVRNYLAVNDPVQRRRLRWVFLGSIAAATPFAVLFVGDLIASRVGVQFEYFAWLRTQNIAQLFLVFLPVTFTYAVLAHRVVGIEVVVRRGLRYLMARNVLRAAVFFPLVLIAVRLLMDPNRTVAEILFQNPIVPGLAIAAALGLSTRERLERWLDRRFFRDASERDRLLVDLVHEIAQRDDLRGLDTLVVARIDQALHPRQTRLLFVDHPQFSAGADALWADSLGAAVTIAIQGGNERPLGMLLLGEKKSEEPYSREDRRLLDAVAAQIAVVCENAALRRRAADDARVRQEVLARIDAASFNLLKECPGCGACYDHSDETCLKDGQTLSLSLPVDRTVDGRYRLDQLLGRGGMGSVYSAKDVRLGRSVAVKLMRDAALAGGESRQRFHREARACARLRHDHIVTLHDYGTTGHDVAYLVMERLVGMTLRTLLNRRGSVVPAVLADWCTQMLDAVGCAHDAGVVHRDLKPENVFVASIPGRGEETIKLLDFSLAKLRLADSDESRSLTKPGSVMGTLAYMSPEQLLGMTVDVRTDLYSIGVIVHECITGRNPFRRDEPQETVAAILHEGAGLGGNHPALDVLEAVLQRSLAKDRGNRFASAREMQSALIPALRLCPAADYRSTAGDGTEPTRL